MREGILKCFYSGLVSVCLLYVHPCVPLPVPTTCVVRTPPSDTLWTCTVHPSPAQHNLIRSLVCACTVRMYGYIVLHQMLCFEYNMYSDACLLVAASL